MANQYNINFTDGSLDFTINEKTIVVEHGLTFTGRGVVDYGQHRNTNLLHLLENFASNTAPASPAIGQIWYNTASNQLTVWDGSVWTVPTTDDFIQSGTYVVSGNQVELSKDPLGDDPSDVIIDNIAEYNAVVGHINQPSNAHSASNITFNDGSVPFAASDLQEAIEDLETELNNHLNDTTGAHAASAISFSPYTTITSTNTQGALQQTEARINALDNLISSAQSLIDNHISDPTAAHASSSIFYDNTTSGLTADNVQDAIDEIESNILSGGSSGLVDCTRVQLTALQLIDGGPGGGVFGTPSKLQFASKLFGDDFNNFDLSPGNHNYTADRNMEVRARAYAMFLDMGNNQFAHIEIRRNGTTIARTLLRKIPSSASNVDQTVEISTLSEINNGDVLEVFASIQSFGVPTADRNVSADFANTGFEIEVLRDLSP